MEQERRSSVRIRAYRPVRLSKPGTPRLVETLTKDLAVGGLRCISATLFPVSTELTVELMLSTGEEPIIARGRTSWFQMIPHSEQFDIGIAFLELPFEHKRRLSAYLDRLSSKTASISI